MLIHGILQLGFMLNTGGGGGGAFRNAYKLLHLRVL